MMLALAFLFGGATGAMIYRATIDGLMLAQADAHKKEMDEAMVELKRARTQVAALIGKE